MTYYVYILECKDYSFYTGVTNNVHRRVDEHVEGLDYKCYTFNRRPLKLSYYTVFSQIELAIAFEKQLKGWSRKKKIALIDGRIDKLPNLSKKNFNK
ncbi:MAG: GIY-YIG nuclease family protein [Weeksellaceae bacterium]